MGEVRTSRLPLSGCNEDSDSCGIAALSGERSSVICYTLFYLGPVQVVAPFSSKGKSLRSESQRFAFHLLDGILTDKQTEIGQRCLVRAFIVIDPGGFSLLFVRSERS